MSDSLLPFGQWPARFLCPGDSLGKNTGVACQFLLQGNLPRPTIEPASLMASALACGLFTTSTTWRSEVKWSQSCPTLCDPVDCSLPDSSVHGILQAKILEWVAISFSRGSSQPRDWTWVSCIAGRRFTLWATRELPAPPGKPIQQV